MHVWVTCIYRKLVLQFIKESYHNALANFVLSIGSLYCWFSESSLGSLFFSLWLKIDVYHYYVCNSIMRFVICNEQLRGSTTVLCYCKYLKVFVNNSHNRRTQS